MAKKAFLNVFFNLLDQFMVIVYGFLVPQLIIKNFGSEVNGLISSITQFLMYISLIESGFGVVVRAALYKPLSEQDNYQICNILYASNKFFKRIAKIFIIYIIALLIIYPLLINSSFNYLYTISLILIISMSIFAEYYFGLTYRLLLRSDQKSYIVSIIQAVSYFICTIFVIVLVKLGFSIHIIKLASSMAFILRPLLQNLYVRTKYKINFDNVDKSFNLKNKWDGLAQHIATVIHDNVDILFLSIFRNLKEVSVYSVYSLVTTGVNNIMASFLNGIDSMFGQMIANKQIDKLRIKFNIYELLYLSITTIIFGCTMVLIVPFVTIYTKNVSDINYIRYGFGYLIVIGQYLKAVREAYNSLTKAAGHFRETMVGAWIECLINVIVSIILVFKFNLIGVAIGTIVAMLFRMIELVNHSNKYILKQSAKKSLIRIFVSIVELMIIVCVMSKIQNFIKIGSYFDWLLLAIITFLISTLITLLLNYIFHKKEYDDAIKATANIFKRRRL